ncbi:uncharacterized protein ColSpa_03177 [Colletotrichum spaethianum]|uniref:Uncharacterized protein n=1 Tax=Colletotrichum spaethianum TaxID=700344 RepID=A0AA37P565_9PEZI|nr:uncharacterized protein ColSpa_03177 [Colletotrichum spaethianum]GKT42996.1 hypothetical protein ColSpa_03177 [Colletotrichum spaethianum]
MGFLKDPPVLDRWDCHDFDGDPGPQRLDKNMDFADGERLLSTSHWAATIPIIRQPSYKAVGQSTISVHGEPIASVEDLDAANMDRHIPDVLSSSYGMIPEALSDFEMAFLDAPISCLNFPTPRRSRGPDGIMKTLSAAV